MNVECGSSTKPTPHIGVGQIQTDFDSLQCVPFLGLPFVCLSASDFGSQFKYLLLPSRFYDK